MSKKIAVLVNEDTMQRCSCGGCLKAYMNKVDSFERYADEDTELVGFTHSGGRFWRRNWLLSRKMALLLFIFQRVRVVRMTIMKAVARQCAAAGFDVVGYTHGGAVSKDGKVAIELVGESNN